MAIIDSPQRIEARSFEIIDGLLKNTRFSGKPQKDIVKRVIHTTVDTRYAKDLVFSETAISAGINALKGGKNIVVDSSMVKAGINRVITAAFKNKVICQIQDKSVARQAARLQLTRAIVAMRKAVKRMDGGIVAIGNAPTALFELCDLIKSKKARPALIVGIPVGFVGAAESKKALRTLSVPYITNKTKRGGSTVAAAIVNALLILARDRR